MKIRHVSVKNFRGIRQLEWDVRSDIVCLVGPGDSTKTTVLNAIAYALEPGRFLGLNDADFHAANIDEPILIEVTVTHPPPPPVDREQLRVPSTRMVPRTRTIR